MFICWRHNCNDGTFSCWGLSSIILRRAGHIKILLNSVMNITIKIELRTLFTCAIFCIVSCFVLFLNVSLSWLFSSVTRNDLAKRAKSWTFAQEHTLENYQQLVTISLFQVCADSDAGSTFWLVAFFKNFASLSPVWKESYADGRPIKRLQLLLRSNTLKKRRGWVECGGRGGELMLTQRKSKPVHAGSCVWFEVSGKMPDFQSLYNFGSNIQCW